MIKKSLVLGLFLVGLGLIALAVNGCGSSGTATTTNPTLTINGASS